LGEGKKEQGELEGFPLWKTKEEERRKERERKGGISERGGG